MAVETLIAESPVLVEEIEPEPELHQTGPKVVGISVSRNGSCKTITTYLEGYNPHRLGRLHHGLTGDETAIDRVAIKPVRTFLVVENSRDLTPAGVITRPPPFSRFDNLLSQARKAGEGLTALQEDGHFPLNARREVDSLIGRIRALVQFVDNPDATPDIREIAVSEAEKNQPPVPIG